MSNKGTRWNQQFLFGADDAGWFGKKEKGDALDQGVAV